MLERLLVPLDASSGAETVLPAVTALAKALDQPVVLLAVVPDPVDPFDSVEHQPALARLMTARRGYAREYLDGIAADLAAAGIAAAVRVETGPIAEVITTTAAEEHAGLIALTSHAGTGAEPWFLGSVADRVVRSASMPVLVTRPSTVGADTAVIRTVIVPVDGSALAEAALPYASFLAKALGASVSLFRATPPNLMITAAHPYGMDAALPREILAAMRDRAEAYLQRIAEPLRASGLDVSTHFEPVSSPAGGITELAAHTEGALIVMATHGQSGLGRVLLGSVTDRVIRSASAPVLVVRAGPAVSD